MTKLHIVLSVCPAIFFLTKIGLWGGGKGLFKTFQKTENSSIFGEPGLPLEEGISSSHQFHWRQWEFSNPGRAELRCLVVLDSSTELRPGIVFLLALDLVECKAPSSLLIWLLNVESVKEVWNCHMFDVSWGEVDEDMLLLFSSQFAQFSLHPAITFPHPPPFQPCIPNTRNSLKLRDSVPAASQINSQFDFALSSQSANWWKLQLSSVAPYTSVWRYTKC